MEGMINVTGASLVELVKGAYDLSKPQGMGMLHYQEGTLTDAEEQRILDAYNAKGFWYKLWHESDIDSWWYWHNVGYSHEIISLYEKYSNLKNPPKNVIVSQRIYDHIKR